MRWLRWFRTRCRRVTRIGGSPPASLLERLRGDLERAVSATFDATGPRFRTSFGVGFDFQDGAKDVFEFSSAGKQSLESSLRTKAGDVSALCLGPNSSVPRGLIADLTSVLSEAASDIDLHLGVRGLSVDVLA